MLSVCLHASRIVIVKSVSMAIHAYTVILYTNQGITIESSVVFIRELFQCDTKTRAQNE